MFNAKEYLKAYRKKNPEKYKKYTENKKKKYQTEPEEKRKKVEYRQRNQERRNEYLAEWRSRNPNYSSEYMKRRRKEHPGKVKTEERLKDSKRRQRNVYPQYKQQLEEIYANCPEGYVVDHIIPLQNKNVSGLHAPWNLQYLTTQENNYKRNKFDMTYQNNSWRK